MIKKYFTKPATIEAMLFDGTCVEGFKIVGWSKGKVEMFHYSERDDECAGLQIRTLEGIMRADIGDYIIKGLRGEFYPCKPDTFHAKYAEIVE